MDAIYFDYLLTAMMKARTTFFFSLEMLMATELLNIVQLYALAFALFHCAFWQKAEQFEHAWDNQGQKSFAYILYSIANVNAKGKVKANREKKRK